MEKDIIKYNDYIKKNQDPSYTNEYAPPETGVIPQPGDKIVKFMKTQFNSQIKYFDVSIRSVNPDLPDYKNDDSK